MTSFEYKILFEVRFLHDFYLYGMEPGGDGRTKSYFAMGSEAQELRLAELVRAGRYDIQKDLNILVSPEVKKLFKNQRMKILNTATGFAVGVEVDRVTVGNDVLFKPVIRLPQDAYITIGLFALNPYFGSISNLRLDRDEDKIYYFTNEGFHDDLSLASPLGALVAGRQYRMGDLALVAGAMQQAIADNSGDTRFWSPIEGAGFISQIDRRLSPQEDWYSEWKSTARISSKRPTGVIKIVLNSGNGQLSPIDDNGLLETRLDRAQDRFIHPVFELRWLSRPTYWRYSKRVGFSVQEKQRLLNEAGTNLRLQDEKFITRIPRMVTQERQTSPWLGDSIQLPQAQPGSIKVEGGRIFSDIEFNELNPVPIGA